MANGFVKFFTDTTFRYTEADVLATKHIFRGRGNFKRWMLIPPAVFVQLCAGSFYAWTVLKKELVKKHEFMTKEEEEKLKNMEYFSNAAFYVCIAFFGLSSCITGPFMERRGPLIPAILGSILFFIGNMICSIGLGVKDQEWLLVLGYGLFVGTGIGMSYLTPVTVLQKWYPERRGAASGIAVGSFGLGSSIAALVNQGLVQLPDRYLWFLIPGIVYFLLQLPSSFMMRFPIPNSESKVSSSCTLEKTGNAEPIKEKIVREHLTPAAEEENVKSVSVATFAVNMEAQDTVVAHSGAAEMSVAKPNSSQLISNVLSLRFFLVVVLVVAACMPGLSFVSDISEHLAQLYSDNSFNSAVPTIVGLFNVLGRFVVAVASDKFGRSAPLIATILLQACSLLGILYATDVYELKSGTTTQYWVYVMSMWMLIMGYGSVLGVVPGMLGDMFGSGNVGALYGFSLVGWSSSGLIAGFGVKWMFPKFLAKTHITFGASIYCMLVVLCVAVGCAVAIALITRRSMQKQRAIMSA